MPSGLSTTSSMLASGGTVLMDLMRITRFSSIGGVLGVAVFSKSACNFSKFFDMVWRTSIGTE